MFHYVPPDWKAFVFFLTSWGFWFTVAYYFFAFCNLSKANFLPRVTLFLW